MTPASPTQPATAARQAQPWASSIEIKAVDVALGHEFRVGGQAYRALAHEQGRAGIVTVLAEESDGDLVRFSGDCRVTIAYCSTAAPA